MTWPAGSITTANVDAGTDSPAAARSQFKDLIDQFLQLVAHVTSFMQGLLTSANAAAARSTLGAAASGANADITSLSGLAGTPFPAAFMPLGAGQTWSQPTRALNTTYTNSTGRPIFVMVSIGTSVSGTANIAIILDGLTVASSSTVFAQGNNVVSFVVPNGQTYRVEVSSGTGALQVWGELS